MFSLKWPPFVRNKMITRANEAQWDSSPAQRSLVPSSACPCSPLQPLCRHSPSGTSHWLFHLYLNPLSSEHRRIHTYLPSSFAQEGISQDSAFTLQSKIEPPLLPLSSPLVFFSFPLFLILCYVLIYLFWLPSSSPLLLKTKDFAPPPSSIHRVQL